MDFKTATDRVAGCISHAEIAEAAGVSVQTIRQARLDPSAPGHRPPPVGWRAILALLARRRAGEMEQFAALVEVHAEDDGGSNIELVNSPPSPPSSF